MNAAMVGAVSALIAGLATAVAAMYGSRGANRAAQEGTAVTGFSSLTNELQEERKDLKDEVAGLKLELKAEKAESARLRLLVQQLGGTP